MEATAPQGAPHSGQSRVSTLWRRRVLLVFLAALSVWPLAHHGLVRAFDMDAWRLLGFSMYAVPKPLVKVQAVEMSWAPEVPDAQRVLPEPVKRAFDRQLWKLRNGRQTLGLLYPWQTRFVRMFAVLPEEVGKLTIVLTRSYLDTDAMLRLKLLIMECRRSDDSTRISCDSFVSRLEDWNAPA